METSAATLRYPFPSLSFSPTETAKAIMAEVLANFPANFRFLGWQWLCKGRTGHKETK